MFINVSAYKFVRLDNLPRRREVLLGLCTSLQLKGTILLSPEGINLFVAGTKEGIARLVEYFDGQPEYVGLPIKQSPSSDQPFTRMLVRIKKEIIAFGVEGIEPDIRTSPKLDPLELKRWLDEGRRVTLLDVRNDYEVQLGTFRNAVPIGIDHFRDFGNAIRRLPESLKQERVVMFCTGGIRCEKAGPLMEREGFQDIFQLDGGILKYFETCGGEHYQGDCFVFDKRVAVNAGLGETEIEQCFACQHPLTLDDQQSPLYEIGKSCPYCYQSPTSLLESRLRTRNASIRQFTAILPGSVPYDNHRPLNVPLRFDGQNVVEFLTAYHAHLDPAYWQSEIDHRRLLYKDLPVKRSDLVWAGQRLVHLLNGSVEPDVDGRLEVIYEDGELVAVNKPAPLPMHPCGRFNRNSLSYILNHVYRGEKIRMIHRLDANTTGVVVLARKRRVAQLVQTQFEKSLVRKVYLALVVGHSEQDRFTVDCPISIRPAAVGARTVADQGSAAVTEFQVLERFADSTSLIACFPKTGRTNQIRIHLWDRGTPVVNDPTYLPDHRLGESQTLPLGGPAMHLHSWMLNLRHPTSGSLLELIAPTPAWLSCKSGSVEDMRAICSGHLGEALAEI